MPEEDLPSIGWDFFPPGPFPVPLIRIEVTETGSLAGKVSSRPSCNCSSNTDGSPDRPAIGLFLDISCSLLLTKPLVNLLEGHLYAPKTEPDASYGASARGGRTMNQFCTPRMAWRLTTSKPSVP